MYIIFGLICVGIIYVAISNVINIQDIKNKEIKQSLIDQYNDL
jgi:archaellum component FlaF (FlaF/FlaG flagellin family)